MEGEDKKQPKEEADNETATRNAELNKQLQEIADRLDKNKADQEAKLDKLIEEKVQERLKNRESDLEIARKLVKEAEERAELNKQINENLKYKTKDEKVQRFREEIIYAMNEVARCGDEHDYNVQVFNMNSDNPQHKLTRDLYIMVKKYGAEKAYNYLAHLYFPRWAIKQEGK